MKNITFLLCLLVTTLGFSQVVVLEDFEGTPASVFAGFEGLGSAATAVDPTDAGNTVLEMVSSSGGQGWQGAEILMQENFMNVAAGNITVEVDVYSSVSFSFLGKVENGQSGAPDSAQQANYTNINTWQTLTFTFDNPLDNTTQNANGDYEKLALFPNWNGAGWTTPPGDFTIYIDNISAEQGAAIVAPETCSDGILNNGETMIDCGGPNCAPCTAGTPVVLEDFDGTAPTLIANNNLGGIAIGTDPTDGSNSVLEVISSSGGEGWQGAEVLMQDFYMDVSNPVTVSIDVYSTQAFEMLGKVQDGQSGAPDSAQEAAYTATSTWQTLTFTFNNPLDNTTQNANGDYESFEIFPNWMLGGGWNVPPGDFTFYVDNITAVQGAAIVAPETCDDGILNNGETMIDCGGPNCAPCTAGTPVVLEDFEGTPAFGAFEGLGNVATAVDPTDAGNTVLELISSSGGQGWQGAEVVMQDFYMDVSNPVTVSIDVYSTQTFDMLGKVVAGQDGAPDSAQEASYTTASAWQTLTFTFNNPLDNTTQNANGDYERFALFPNWNGAGWNTPPGDFTFYIDNITAVQGAAIIVPETCDDGILNNGETEIDCGGPNCAPCAETCDDGILNNGETEIDCGGPNCAPCETPGTPVILEDFEGTPAAVFAGFEGLGSVATATDPTDPGNTVLELVSSSGGQGWQGAEVLMQEYYMDVTNPLTVSIDVYASQAFDMLGKVEAGQSGAPDSAQEASYTATGTWQTITFTFNNPLDSTTQNADGEYEKFTLFPNWILGGGWNTPPGDFTFYIDNITAVQGAAVVPPTITYVYNNGWAPSDPAGASGSLDTINIVAGDVVISADTQCDVLNIQPGASMTIDLGVSMTTNTTTLFSTSFSFSSIIPNGNLFGTVNYHRFTSLLATTGGTNDLISPPLSGQFFGDFAAANPNLPQQGNLRAFAPYNTVAGAYENLDVVADQFTVLGTGVGYRAATIDGNRLIFTGTVLNNDVLDIPITDAGSGSAWNLIGNPYPSYMDFDSFFNLNLSQFESDGAFLAVYGYDGSATNGWTVWNLATIADNAVTELIAPGQGFFVKSQVGGGLVDYTASMRRSGSSDDFILGRSASSLNVALSGLNLSSASNSANTKIYFIDGTTRGLDPGYDAGSYQGNAGEFSIYTNLVENNEGLDMQIQTLPYNDFNDVVIPLGVKAVAGTPLTISLNDNSTVPANVNVYLEDTLENTFTLLNTTDYTFTLTDNLIGTGRFFLRYSSETLSISDNTELNELIIYSSDKNIVVKGMLTDVTSSELYDIQGRLVLSTKLDQSSLTNTINAASLSAGVYIIKVSNKNSVKTQKLIIK